MAKFERYAPGQFSWVDLMTSDIDGSKRFYSALFGWTIEASADDQGSAYDMCRLDGHDVAGMGAMPEALKQAGMPTVWSSYVTVEDVDVAAARAEKLGAKLQMPVIDVKLGGELIGRMTQIIDPEGARLSLWQPGRHTGSGLANVPGSFGWNELCCKDVDGAVRFYQELFGWRVGDGDAENGYRQIFCGQRLNGGILPWRPEMGDFPANWSVYFAVADCDAAVSRIKELGGKLMLGPVDIEAGRFAVVMDPQGAPFQVMHIKNLDE